ncbi:MAG: hypothetical protein KDI33_17480 [Halioglobus sp.]|nr:hypothetical protein [Halioglobus sp.]
MRELFLHIGCPKTGSSALQSWLAINQSTLIDQGYHFAVTDGGARHFRINSGNAGVLDSHIRQNPEQATSNKSSELEILELYFSGFDKAIVSSEILSGLRVEYIEKLKALFDQHNIRVRVIAYVRNLYDFFYSAHVQHVKRTNRLISFEEATTEERHFRHFQTYRNFSKYFDVTLIHYDSVLDNIALPFCDAIGVDYSQLIPLPAQQVNRTLSPDEIEVVQCMGKWLAGMGIEVDDFSRIVSDDLVHKFPETESRAVYSDTVYQYLAKTFGEQIDAFNAICENQFDFKLSILGNRAYQPQVEGQSLDRETLERVVDVISENSARIDRKAIEGLADKLSTWNEYQYLAAKLRKSLAWKNRVKQRFRKLKHRLYGLLLVATDRKLLILRLREKMGAYR